MEDYPKTLAELEKRFSTDEDCRAYLSLLRWPDGYVCPHCGHEQAWHMSRGYLLCQKCRYQQSVMQGTIFQDTHVPLVTWFRAMWYICVQKNGASALGLQRNLGLGSYRTAWMMLHKLRSAMVHHEIDRLSGTIEVDETYIGGVHEGKRGRGATGKTLVVIAAERNEKKIGRIRMTCVPTFNSDSLREAVMLMCESGSMIITDGLKSYSSLSKNGYSQIIDDAVGSSDKHPLPYCHMVSNLLKRWIIGTLQGSVSQEHLQDYLNEFVFRFNRRKSASRGKLFYRLAQHSVISSPATYRSITQRSMFRG